MVKKTSENGRSTYGTYNAPLTRVTFTTLGQYQPRIAAMNSSRRASAYALSPRPDPAVYINIDCVYIR
jgi:hypothetical protein